MRGRTCLRTYCKECERALEHRRWLKGNRLTSQRSWEPVLKDDRLAQAILTSAEIRWLSHDLEHQLRVLRQTGRTGYERHY